MAARRGAKDKKKSEKPAESATSWSPADFEKVGPRSIEGLEASELPDKGRGTEDTNPSKEAGRKLPQQTGENDSGDTGLRGDPDIADAAEHGHRKRN
jgi:hypothetical protein